MRYLFSLLLAGLFLSAGAQAPTNGLLLHYTFDNDAADASGNGINGEIIGGVKPAADRFGNPCGALHFNGTDAYLQVADNNHIHNLGNSFTVSVWFMVEKKEGQKNEIRLMLLNKGGTQIQGAFLRAYMGQLFWNASAPVSLSNDYSGNDDNYGKHRMEYGKWYFFALVHDESWVQAYLNGELIWQGVYSKRIEPNNAPVEIARDYGEGYFSGSLDELRVYDRGLTTNEIQALYADETGKVQKTGFTIHLPGNIVQNTDSGKCTATVQFSEPTATDGCAEASVKQISGLRSGSAFNVGASTITYEANSAGGKKTEGSFTITVKDNEPPVFVCPKDITVKTEPGTGGTTVDYPAVAFSDNCPNAGAEVVSGLAPGAKFPVGTTNVTYTATDEAGNTSTCSFNVTVKEDYSPIVRCGADIVAIATPETNDQEITYEVPTVEYHRQKYPMTLVNGLPPGARFKAGETKVDYVMRGTGELSGLKCSFTVKVKDVTPPTMNCPASVTVTANAGQKSAAVAYNEPSAMDGGMQVPVTLISGPKSGDRFPIGSTIVTFMAKDAAGNRNECSFTVTVQPKEKNSDNQQPLRAQAHNDDNQKAPLPPKPIEIACPPDIQKAMEPGQCGAVVNYTAPKTHGSNATVQQVKGLRPGAFFPCGTTKNVYNITDFEGKSRECSFNVYIKDNEPPVFTNCPADTLIMLKQNRRGVIFNYTPPVAKDNCGAVDSVVQTQGSKVGCFLPVGVHPFRFDVTDTSGNVASCGFTVTVKTDETVENIVVPNQLDNSLALGDDKIHYEYKADVKSCLLTIFIYDDGEEDGDSVSIVFDGQMLVDKSMLRLREHGAIKRQLVLSSNNDNYLVAKAWNTGRVGLNTMRIDIFDGDVDAYPKNKKPVLTKVMHAKPGDASGIILKCTY